MIMAKYDDNGDGGEIITGSINFTVPIAFTTLWSGSGAYFGPNY
jgi:hypothetical protein